MFGDGDDDDDINKILTTTVSKFSHDQLIQTNHPTNKTKQKHTKDGPRQVLNSETLAWLPVRPR